MSQKTNLNINPYYDDYDSEKNFYKVSAGTDYVNPEIFVSEPTYEGLEIEGISRLGFGNTTLTGVNLLVDIEVGAATTSGIGSDTFEVSNFKIARNGYGFRKGDIIRPVGLVTNRILTSSTVLKIDDISNTFSNLNNFTDSDSKNLFTFNNSDSFDDVLVRVTNTNNTQVQLAEFTIISDNSGGNFLLEKGNIANIVDNDFLIETNEISRQKSVIESITEGPIEKINILNSGIGYKVNDSLNFDSTGTNGDGVIAKITSILGKNVYDIQTSVETYDA